MDAKVIVALITAVVSFILAIFNALWNRRNQENVEVIKAKFAEQKAEKDARRDYLYDARKRLYEECEPIFFQLNEAVEGTVHRIWSLARTSRKGKLGFIQGGWLAAEGYYSISTYYKLMAPVGLFKLLSERLTLVDMSVDPIVRARYELIKCSFICWTDDFALAKLKQKIDYDPNVREWRDLRKSNPSKYWRQGLPMGRLEGIADALLVIGQDSKKRLASFGEFEKEFRLQESETRAAFRLLADIVLGFDPRTRPVFWRILVTQAHICEAILRTNNARNGSFESEIKPIQKISTRERLKFDWRQQKEHVPDQSVYAPFKPAEQYLIKRMPELHKL